METVTDEYPGGLTYEQIAARQNPPVAVSTMWSYARLAKKARAAGHTGDHLFPAADPVLSPDKRTRRFSLASVERWEAHRAGRGHRTDVDRKRAAAAAAAAEAAEAAEVKEGVPSHACGQPA